MLTLLQCTMKTFYGLVSCFKESIILTTLLMQSDVKCLNEAICFIIQQVQYVLLSIGTKIDY